MTTRNFRVHNGISVGDIVISASANTITGGATGAPSSDGDFSNKKYVDDSLAGLSQNSISQLNTNVTVSDTGANGTVTVTCDGNAELTVTDSGVRVHGDLTIDGTNTVINTTTMSIEDNILELNRNISSNAGMPDLTGLEVNRGATSTATEQNLLWVWDERFADDGTTIYGNSGGAWTAFRRVKGNSGNPTGNDLVDIRANVLHAKATSALYADLGERFQADQPMAEGAVVTIGGTAEITETTTDLSDNAFGVVSTQPAFMMNAGAGSGESHPFVAMTGRTPVRVTGAVTKGQRLVTSSIKGTARAASADETISPFNVIGRALENKSDAGIGLVNAVVRTNN
tara:strand:+ start:945 stop:1970 length:1026 start_codon:yes stop_codon:yes gene_type:complete